MQQTQAQALENYLSNDIVYEILLKTGNMTHSVIGHFIVSERFFNDQRLIHLSSRYLF